MLKKRGKVRDSQVQLSLPPVSHERDGSRCTHLLWIQIDDIFFAHRRNLVDASASSRTLRALGSYSSVVHLELSHLPGIG